MAGTTQLFLPDGAKFFAPEIGFFFQEDMEVPAKLISFMIGQVGAWYAAPALFQGLNTTAATININSWTSISLQTEMIDSYNMHSTTTNAANVVVPFSGTEAYTQGEDVYLGIGYVPFNSGNNTNVFIAGLWNSNYGFVQEGMKSTGTIGHVIDVMVIDLLPIEAIGDDSTFFQLAGFQTTGGTVNTVVSSKCPSITIRWVGAVAAYTTIDPPPAITPTITEVDQITAYTTGSSPLAGGVKVPINDYIWNPQAWYSSPPMCRVTSQGGSQTFTAGSFQAVNLAFQNLDAWAMWSAANPSRITVPHDGLYLVYGLVGIAEASSGNNGYRAAQLRVNGTTIYGGNTIVPPAADTTGSATNVVALIQMSAGDYVELMFIETQSSGGTTRGARTGNGDNCRVVTLWVDS